MNVKEIRKAAVDFRKSIEFCGASLGIAFENFPSGSCGDTVPLLGTYLIDLNFGNFQYMLGNYGNHEKGTWKSHAWLQSNDLIIDITADQFDEITEKVIVEKDALWHKNLNGKFLHLANYRIYDSNTVSRLNSIYKKIVNHI